MRMYIRTYIHTYIHCKHLCKNIGDKSVGFELSSSALSTYVRM